MGKISGQQVLWGIIYSVSCFFYIYIHRSSPSLFVITLLSSLSCLELVLLTPSAHQKQTWPVWGAVGVATAFLLLCRYAEKEQFLSASLAALVSIPFFYGLLQCCSQCFTNESKWETFFHRSSFLWLTAGGAFIAIAVQIAFCFSSDIWKDEAYSLALISHPWREMMELAAQDVHPPLYYIILKAWTDAVHAVLPSLPIICIAKLVSCLPFVFLLALAVGKVRRTWGNYVGGLFALSLVAAPSLISQGVEIRMYSWAMLFVTLAYVFAYDVIYVGRVRDWVCFTLVGVASAYTHYYACIAVTPVYLLLLYNSFRRGRSSLLPWLLAAIVTIVAYLPWLFVFLTQAGRVAKDYWIGLPSSLEYRRYVMALFGSAPVAGLAALILSQLCGKFCRRKDSMRRVYILSGISCVAFAMLIGLAVTYLIQPVFIRRYMFPAIPCLWLALIVGCDYVGKVPLKAALSIILVGFFICRLSFFLITESTLAKEHHKLMQVLTAHPDAVLVCDNCSDQWTFSRFTDKKCLCLDTEENSDFFKEVFTNISEPNIADVRDLLNQKQHPAYVVLISGNKSRVYYKELLSQYYVGNCKESLLTDMYVIPATEDGTQP